MELKYLRRKRGPRRRGMTRQTGVVPCGGGARYALVDSQSALRRFADRGLDGGRRFGDGGPAIGGGRRPACWRARCADGRLVDGEQSQRVDVASLNGEVFERRRLSRW
jgi:hypothetical protein